MRKTAGALISALLIAFLVQSSYAYENTQYGFSINPPEGWAIEETEPLMFVFKDASNQTGATITILVNQSGLPQDDPFLASLKQLYLRQYLAEPYEGYLITQRGARVVGSLNGYQVKFNASVGGREMRFDSVIFIETNQTFIIICGALSSAFDNLSSDFKENINSFKITSAQSEPPPSVPLDNIMLLGVLAIVVLMIIAVIAIFFLRKRHTASSHSVDDSSTVNSC